MLSYLLARFALAVPVVFGVSLLVFGALRLAPGDTAQILAGFDATPQLLGAIREQYGLDRPWPEQYVRFLVGLAHLDLGRSSVTRDPVVEELASLFPVTVSLAVPAALIACVLGVSAGVLAARYQRTWIDYSVMVAAVAALSIPNYVIGLVLILVFAVTLQLLPAIGASSPLHYIMPVATIGAVAVGTIARQTRSAVLEVLSEDYIRTARAKGLGQPAVLFRHALRNSLIPVITTVGLIFGNLLGGTVIVETVFGVPGVGKYMIDRIALRDYAAVQGAVLLIALSYVFVNLIVDVAYAFIDARVRVK